MLTHSILLVLVVLEDYWFLWCFHLQSSGFPLCLYYLLGVLSILYNLHKSKHMLLSWSFMNICFIIFWSVLQTTFDVNELYWWKSVLSFQHKIKTNSWILKLKPFYLYSTRLRHWFFKLNDCAKKKLIRLQTHIFAWFCKWVLVLQLLYFSKSVWRKIENNAIRISKSFLDFQLLTNSKIYLAYFFSNRF